MTWQSVGTGGSLRVGREIVRQWPALLLPGIIVPVLVVGLRLPLLVVSGAADAIGGVLRGWDGVVVILLVLPPVFGLVVALPTLLGSALVLVMASDALAGRSPSLQRALRVVTARLPQIVGVSAVAIIVVTYGFYFLMVPGVIAGTGLVFALPAVLFDHARPMGALRGSVGLVARHVGPSLGLGVGLCVWLGLLWMAVIFEVPAVLQIGMAALSGVAVVYWSVMVVHVYRGLSGRSEAREG